jgi:hypothetical protein
MLPSTGVKKRSRSAPGGDAERRVVAGAEVVLRVPPLCSCWPLFCTCPATSFARKTGRSRRTPSGRRTDKLTLKHAPAHNLQLIQNYVIKILFSRDENAFGKTIQSGVCSNLDNSHVKSHFTLGPYYKSQTANRILIFNLFFKKFHVQNREYIKNKGISF